MLLHKLALATVLLTGGATATFGWDLPRVNTPSWTPPRVNIPINPPRINVPQVNIPRPQVNVRPGTTTPAMIDWYQIHHQAATAKPFPNATLGQYPGMSGSTRLQMTAPGGHRINEPLSYEIGARNQTYSDIGITAAGIAAGAPNPLLGGAVFPYARDSLLGGGVKYLYKKQYEQERPPVLQPSRGPNDPRNYILSGRAPTPVVPRWTPPRVNVPQVNTPRWTPPRVNTPRWNPPQIKTPW